MKVKTFIKQSINKSINKRYTCKSQKNISEIEIVRL